MASTTSQNRFKDDWEPKVFQSMHIHSGRYSPSRRALRVRFGSASEEYEYQLPPDGWEKLKKADRPGQFFAKNIRPNFPFSKVKPNADV